MKNNPLFEFNSFEYFGLLCKPTARSRRHGEGLQLAMLVYALLLGCGLIAK